LEVRALPPQPLEILNLNLGSLSSLQLASSLTHGESEKILLANMEVSIVMVPLVEQMFF